ncbi:unnamed protein product, partial [Ectocarpus sp. 12 AP-2014]
WACDWSEGLRVESHQSLRYRLMYNSKGELRGASLVLPRSWNIALEVLDTFGSGRDPIESVHRTISAADRSEGGHGAVPAVHHHEG